jgi:hypothetical protein
MKYSILKLLLLFHDQSSYPVTMNLFHNPPISFYQKKLWIMKLLPDEMMKSVSLEQWNILSISTFREAVEYWIFKLIKALPYMINGKIMTSFTNLQISTNQKNSELLNYSKDFKIKSFSMKNNKFQKISKFSWVKQI